MKHRELCGGRRKNIRRGVAAGMILLVCGCVGPAVSASEAADRGGVAAAGAGETAFSSPLTGTMPAAKAGDETWTRRQERVISGGDEPTKVRIRGNSVLVPVTLVCGGREADVHLLLDTGASATTIHSDVADQLSIDLERAKKARVQVVGGEVLEAHVVPLDRLTIGPHTRRNVHVVVVPHRGPAARYHGLLGMDVLRGLKYRVDFKKQVILWE